MRALISQKPMFISVQNIEKACFIVFRHITRLYIIKQMMKPKPSITLW